MFVFRQFVTCFRHYTLKIKSAESASWKTLRSSHSYRLAEGSHQDILIGFRYFLKAVKLIAKKPPQFPDKASIALFKGNASYQVELDYLAVLGEEQPELMVSREDLACATTFSQKLTILFTVLLTSPMLIMLSLVSPKRATYASMQSDLVECMLLDFLRKKSGVKQLWMFDSYEKDCNFISLVLMKRGCHVVRIPSSNIITPYYHHVVCSEFIFTASFQPEEQQQLKENWYVSSMRNLPPFNVSALLHAPRTLAEDSENTIGFISSGVWRRKERGEMASGYGEFESEDLLIDTLSNLLKKRPELNLLIYLHPCEKASPELFAGAMKEYSKHFPEGRFQILDRETPSLQAFHLCNVAVSVYSSANIERLFLGLKTLYFPACFEKNVYADTGLEIISPSSSDQLIELLEAALPMSNSKFFTEFHLEAYRGFGLPSHLQFKS
ncbi:MAG: hypothetical protein KDC12_14725 [Flavobacteriales bacterium]|nr:hypothetical protein [Flavobacteriales bacterium]